MKALRWVMMAGCFCCLFQSVEAMAGNVYGSSSIVYDLANNKVKGISRTILDYETAAYYTAYVCGELYEEGVSQVRACQGGLLSATINTQFTGIASGSVVSDHYVDMQYFDEEYQSYIDYEGYQFTWNGSYPVDWLFLPASIFGYYPVSIRLGDTYFEKALIKLENMRFEQYTTLFSKAGSSPNATTAKATITASHACPGDNCLHANDYAVVELLKGFASETYFSFYPSPAVRPNLALNLGGAVDATFDITVNNNTPSGTYSFTIHILDVKRGSDNSSIPATAIQFVPATAELQKTLTVQLDQ